MDWIEPIKWNQLKILKKNKNVQKTCERDEINDVEINIELI